MHPEAPSTHSTRQRLLEAAARVCAERGLQGATTREIAEAAGVNEVTLFRHFGSKEKLISEIFQRAVAAQMESLSETEPDANDLERDLTRYARRYDEMLMTNEPLIRTLIGEARRHPQEAWQVICEAARPMRERLIGYLRAAQKAGSVRTDIPLGATIDAFTGMLLAGMLRRTSFKQAMADYSPDEYVANVVELFLRGIATPEPSQKPAPVRRKRVHA
ncbi:MAG: TetR/AcrR family transcriptional regulator [Paludisphaera borealis]|uniref:TetR/AcrR family transcriptional regulator n=1 Tax=Paludisphaera borealis TaxID=1387353 RepID=UPI00284E8E63|nr:TetR/AcrR family transcriptional regulator [Paludisphaera borealis]MDR3622834.1 TetR/AcrR family transcriptional regulator [Paludisphaera borealis]